MGFQQAMKNPGRTFGSRAVLEASTDFTVEQKHVSLLHWKNQLARLKVATEEGMPGPESNGAGAECLQAIVDALTRLGA